MANYGRQVTSDEARGQLEDAIFDSDRLWTEYREKLGPLFQDAELRLDQTGQFQNMESSLKRHINQWFTLTKNISNIALQSRQSVTHLDVQLHTLKQEVGERDKIIQTQRKEHEASKRQYEEHLKVLETALAQSVPRNKTLDKLEQFSPASDDVDGEVRRLRADVSTAEREYLKVKSENGGLRRQLEFARGGASDAASELAQLAGEVNKKEEEILKLRWLTEDLAAERNGLEAKVQRGQFEAGKGQEKFVSVTPQRQMEYTVDLSKFMDDDEDEDMAHDPAERGFLRLEMADDTEINPEVQKKLREALEAVQQFAKQSGHGNGQHRNDHNQEKQQQQQEQHTMNDERRDVVVDMQSSNNNNMQNNSRPSGNHYSHDDMALGRRASIQQFAAAAEAEHQRRSGMGGDVNKMNKLQQEDRRRSKHSQRRRSSVSNIPMGLLPPQGATDEELWSKSDVGRPFKNEPMDDSDVAYLKSIGKSLPTLPNSTHPKETPANSPIQSPARGNLPGSPRSEDGAFQLDVEPFEEPSLDVPLFANSGSSSSTKRSSKNQQSQVIESLRKQLSDKAVLISDLQAHEQELKEHRAAELGHLQEQLQAMKAKCREWYSQLMERVREMEEVYADKISADLASDLAAAKREMEQEMHKDFSHRLVEERLRMKEHYEGQLDAERERSIGANRDRDNNRDADPHEIDELQREIARLNEELEKFKGRYFDSEQRKIELADQLEEIKEEKFKLGEKVEQLELDLQQTQSMAEEVGVGVGVGGSGKSVEEWNQIVQALREEKETQETQYEEEFREFERMANAKVVQLEEYYVQQLQLKEVQLQHVAGQLQQQHQVQQQNGHGAMKSVNGVVAQLSSEQLQQLAGLQAQSAHQSEEVSSLRQENHALRDKLSVSSGEHSKLSQTVSRLRIEQEHERAQLKVFAERNATAESKMSAYNTSFIELAEKLKQLNDDTKSLRKEKDKARRKVEKVEKKHKKLKAEQKDLMEKVTNIEAVTKDLVHIKREAKAQSEQWQAQREQHREEVAKMRTEMGEMARKKIDSIDRYNVEMNNLRSNIKTLQRRVQQTELENDKLRETDSQSVLGSLVPGSSWWTTKK